MSRIPTITEQELSHLQPTGLDEDFLARLTACAEGSDVKLSEDEIAFEVSLRALRPRAIPGSLQNSLITALGDTPFAVNEKILLFHKSSAAAVIPSKKRKTFRFNVAAAAAVALLGSLAALMVPAGNPNSQIVEEGDMPGLAPAPITSAPSQIAPASFGSQTRDEGVIWRDKTQPHRVIRRVFMEQVMTQDANGRPVTEQLPRLEYMIIPEKID